MSGLLIFFESFSAKYVYELIITLEKTAPKLCSERTATLPSLVEAILNGILPFCAICEQILAMYQRYITIKEFKMCD